jgi:YD repeat-containing protein
MRCVATLAYTVDNFWTYQYNADDQQTQSTDPLGNSTITTYNEAGLVSSVTDREGRVEQMSYNDDGQLTQEVWLDAQGNVTDTFSYTCDVFGRLATASNSEGTYSFDYNCAPDRNSCHFYS